MEFTNVSTGIKEKVFYTEGELLLTMMIRNGTTGSTVNAKNLFLVSDDLNSKFYKLKKFVKQEKDNPAFSELIPCIEKGMKRYGYNPKFKDISKCIRTFMDTPSADDDR